MGANTADTVPARGRTAKEAEHSIRAEEHPMEKDPGTAPASADLQGRARAATLRAERDRAPARRFVLVRAEILRKRQAKEWQAAFRVA